MGNYNDVGVGSYVPNMPPNSKASAKYDYIYIGLHTPLHIHLHNIYTFTYIHIYIYIERDVYTCQNEHIHINIDSMIKQHIHTQKCQHKRTIECSLPQTTYRMQGVLVSQIILQKNKKPYFLKMNLVFFVVKTSRQLLQ